ncbi:hypothetical protein SADUNF_Sadunf12G0073700 [Salix dunnii]|uniref:Uncharacterized protein n=1 Tax=Salix dunnii TaxID=1413687 RepID=A0A835MPJ4_9ROSI|nr:hypothetical protein SADUNF_Sadunf12G0073700 [Salix dunnii]
MDCGVSVSKSPNSSTKIETEKISLPSSKESPAIADNRISSWLDSTQSFMVSPVVNSKDISVSVKEALNSSTTMNNETNNISSPPSSDDIPVIVGNAISTSSLDSDLSTPVLPVTNSQYTGVPVNETLNSSMTNEIDKVSILSFSQETLSKSDKPTINTLDSDLSSMEPLMTNSQRTNSFIETLNSSSSNEMVKVCMPSSSRGSPVKTDNPIDKNSLESDQSLLAPPSTASQYIIFSIDETLNSAMGDGMEKQSMPSSFEESQVIADDRLVENSLDSDQPSMEPLVTNSQVTSVPISETPSAASSNEKDKVCMVSSSGSPADTDNHITENSSESDQSLLAPASTNSQEISVSVNETPNSAMSNGTAKLPMPSSSEESLVIADNRLVENSLDSDQFFIVLPERKSQGIGVSVSETLSSSSNETDKVFNPSYSTVSADNPIAKNSMDSDQSSTAPPMTESQNIVSEENFYDCQTWLGSDSDDDFFSVKGEYSNASSRQSSMKGSPQLDEISDSKREPYPTKGGKNFADLFCDRNSMPPPIQETKLRKFKQEATPIDENMKLAELLRDPSWSDHANDHISSTPILKETKLVEFFQDSHWSQEIASTRATRFPGTIGDGKLNSDVEAKHLHPRDGISTVTREYRRTPHSRTRYVSGDLKPENTARATYCCFPSWSPIRGSHREEKAHPHSI